MSGGKSKPSIFPPSCSPCSSTFDLCVSSLSGLREPGWGRRPGLAASQHSLVPTVCPAGQSSLPGPEVTVTGSSRAQGKAGVRSDLRRSPPPCGGRLCSPCRQSIADNGNDRFQFKQGADGEGNCADPEMKGDKTTQAFILPSVASALRLPPSSHRNPWSEPLRATS